MQSKFSYNIQNYTGKPKGRDIGRQRELKPRTLKVGGTAPSEYRLSLLESVAIVYSFPEPLQKGKPM